MQNNSGHLSRCLLIVGVRIVLMMVPMVTLAQPTLLLDSLKLSNGTGTLTLQAPAS